MRLLPDKPAEEPTNEGASRSAKPIPGLAYLYDDDPKEEQKVTKQKRSKGKRTVRRVNYELLSQPEGLPALYDQFKSFKIDESLSVIEQMEQLLTPYREWAKDLMPSYTFEDLIERTEKLSGTYAIRGMLDSLQHGEGFPSLEEILNKRRAPIDGDSHSEDDAEGVAGVMSSFKTTIAADDDFNLEELLATSAPTGPEEEEEEERRRKRREKQKEYERWRQEEEERERELERKREEEKQQERQRKREEARRKRKDKQEARKRGKKRKNMVEREGEEESTSSDSRGRKKKWRKHSTEVSRSSSDEDDAHVVQRTTPDIKQDHPTQPRKRRVAKRRARMHVQTPTTESETPSKAERKQILGEDVDDVPLSTLLGL